MLTKANKRAAKIEIFSYILLPFVNINKQKVIKIFKKIITFESYAITSLQTPSIFLAEHNQLKKRLNFLETTAFLKANKFVKRSKIQA